MRPCSCVIVVAMVAIAVIDVDFVFVNSYCMRFVFIVNSLSLTLPYLKI